MTARTGRLLDLYGAEVLAKAVADALRGIGLSDPNAPDVVRRKKKRRAA